MPRLPERVLPKDLPEIRIKVEPHQGFFFNWHWMIQKKGSNSEMEWWDTVLVGVFDQLHGYTRTQERAFEKGRKASADYCEKILAQRARERAHEAATAFEKVTCQEEPIYE